jgi:peroxiredoxin
MAINTGQPAPPFRIPSGQGPEVSLDDYRDRCAVILFFAKGMACGFCRQKMSQLRRGMPRFRELGAEIAMISPTTLERGRFYARNFPLPFPYCCDPDYQVHEAYGLTVRPRSIAWKAVAGARALLTLHPGSDLGDARPRPSEFPRLLTDDDLGLFILDRTGIVRYALAGNQYSFNGTKLVGVRPIPSNEDIAAQLEHLPA